ncbi:MAG: trigger factor [bacterium]
MKIEKKNLPKSQVELAVNVSVSELEPFLSPAVSQMSNEMKIEGFRPGNVPYDVLKSKIGELPIIETAAHLLINKEMEKLIKDNIDGLVIGQPQINITKLAPGNDMEFKVVFDLLPKVELKDYKDLNIKQESVEVSQEEVDKVISQLREAQVKEVLADREIRDNDKAIVDIKMFLDKIPVDQGQSQNTAVIIGKDYIIPGFDKNLLKAKKGDVKTFTLVYPSDHYQSNLAGKNVEFEVKINDVFERELPEVNSEFVKNFGLKNVEEMKSNIKKSLEQEKEQKAKQKSELAMLDKIIANSIFGEIPDSLIESETDLMLREMEYHLSMQGANLENYLQSIKKSKEQLAKEMEPEALKRVKSALLVREIALSEKIEASQDEINKEVKRMLEYYKGDKEIESKIKNPPYQKHMENQIVQRKALDKLKEWNIK